MKTSKHHGIQRIGVGLLTGGMLFSLSACAHNKPADTTPTTSETSMSSSDTSANTAVASASTMPSDASASADQTPTTMPSQMPSADMQNSAAPMAVVGVSMPQAPGSPADGQTTFSDDKSAAEALVNAARDQDHDQVHAILGPAWKELLSGDKVADAKAMQDFTSHAGVHTQLDEKSPTLTVLDIGDNNWPFPIPIEKTSDGKWFFDTEAGKTEILARRIGHNELNAIDVANAYVRAQREYFRASHDDSGMVQYAQHILSDPGTQDGLYWPAAADQPQSPFGPLIAQADDEGYAAIAEKHSHTPYHGYYFRILKSQGPDAPGGAYSYIINGHMVAGFALVAFPDSYHASGIMTFIVNQNGKVFQKDLGADTTNLAWKLTDYDPDSSWTEVAE